MRASPDFQISLRRFGVWRAAVAVIAVAGLIVLATWAAGRVESLDGKVLALLWVIGAAVLWAAWSSTRVPASTLRWDGQHWWLGRSGLPDDEAAAGRLAVAIDLGPWMLLRFEPEVTGVRQHAVWLPAQRRGLEAQWHALRCAVHSPHAAPAAP